MFLILCLNKTNDVVIVVDLKTGVGKKTRKKGKFKMVFLSTDSVHY